MSLAGVVSDDPRPHRKGFQGWYDKCLGLDGVQHNAEEVLNKA